MSSSRLVLIVVALCVAVVGAPRAAHADEVTRLIGQLSKSRDYKVRLSAALNLKKIGDSRAIPVFIAALKDKDKTVRGVAAASLAKMVSSNTAASTRGKALAALKSVAGRDSNSFVRKQAQKAYDSLKKLKGSGAATKGGTYISVGGMAATPKGSRSLVPLMRRTAMKTFKKKASSMMIEWPGGSPSKKQLSAKKMNAFYVDGTLNELSARSASASTMVSCKVSMVLATYPDKSMFGFLKGGAKVQAGSSEKDIRYAKEDCVAAVIEDLVARKVIPTILTRTR